MIQAVLALQPLLSDLLNYLSYDIRQALLHLTRHVAQHEGAY